MPARYNKPVLIVDALAAVIDLVAPRTCAGCDRPSVAALCPACVADLIDQPPLATGRIGAAPLHTAFLFAGPVRRCVHAAKFRDRPEAIRLLAAVAAERLAPALAAASPGPDAVVAVPLSSRRRRQRGYNQAALAAQAFAGLPCGGPLTEGLVRIRDTAAQVGSDAASRRTNVGGAFRWMGSPLRPGARVWLVDDVVTTGATLSAAAETLQRAGAGRIDSVAVGCAP